MNCVISQRLAEAIHIFRDIVREYQFYSEKLAQIEKMKLDLLHYIELDGTDYRERNKFATQLRRCLLKRRIYKDEVELRAPLAEFFALPQNKNLLDQLGKVLGKTRGVERHHQNRSYHPRVLPRPSADIVGAASEDSEEAHGENMQSSKKE